MKILDMAKRSLQTWLEIEPPQSSTVRLKEKSTYESNAFRNRIWYRGDGEEILQLYENEVFQNSLVDFWGSKSSKGNEIRRVHTGIPGLIVDALTKLTLSDLNKIELNSPTLQEEWDFIEKDNYFEEILEEATKECLFIGDGAFKISFDPDVTNKSPIIEWWSGDRIEIITKRSRLHEVIFKTTFIEKKKRYELHEICGFGYLRYELYEERKEKPLSNYNLTEYTSKLSEFTFDKNIILAIPFKITNSSRWKSRGQSIFDRKIQSFDALDEVFSQWMDSLRKGRSKEYIPESLVPRNPNDGSLIKPNSFDNSFIAIGDDMTEGGHNKVQLEQANIPHESYLSTYITALDLALQGIISPSTLGIDTKKLDNAEAQREKEKTTLYTRDSIINAINKTIPILVEKTINAKNVMLNRPLEEIKATVTFGEYANPSFESQIETIGKGKTNGILSIEAAIDELYGDTKDEDWKKEEIERIKQEQGISKLEEPKINYSAGSFLIGEDDENKDSSKNL